MVRRTGRSRPKDKAFGSAVEELKALRTVTDNPHALKLFSNMTDEDIEQAISVVTWIPGEQIRQVILNSGGVEASVMYRLTRVLLV